MATGRSGRYPFVIFLIGLSVLVPACARRASHSVRLQQQWNARCKEAADLLAGVTDAASARATAPRLNVVLDQIEKVSDELERTYDSEDVNEVKRKPMTEAAAQGIVELQRLAAETLRVSEIPGASDALGETWNKLPTVAMLEASGRLPRPK